MPNLATRADIYAALARKSGFEVVQEHETGRQLRFVGRSYNDKWNFFLPVLHTLFTYLGSPNCPVTCDVSKQYFLREGKVLYGWRFIFQADDLPRHYGDIMRVIESSPRPDRVELDSYPLPGYAPGQMRGGTNEKGKGVASAGSLPMILSRGK